MLIWHGYKFIQICSVTITAVVSVVEDLTSDWSEQNKHSRHILGARGLVSLTVHVCCQFTLTDVRA